MEQAVLHFWYILHAALSVSVLHWVREFIMARCWSGPPKKPAFNLTAKLWRNYSGFWVGPPVVPESATLLVAMVCGDRFYNNVTGAPRIFLLMDKGTDVHFARSSNPPGQDYFECPAGSGMYYQVFAVDDVGKGYLNEYRQVMVIHWPPYPAIIP